MIGAEEIFQLGPQRRLVQTYREHGPFLGTRPLNLAQHMRGVDCVLRQHEHEHPAGIDCLDDRSRIGFAWAHVAGRDPARLPGFLEGCANIIGCRHVLRCVTDEHETERGRRPLRCAVPAGRFLHWVHAAHFTCVGADLLKRGGGFKCTRRCHGSVRRDPDKYVIPSRCRWMVQTRMYGPRSRDP